MPSCNSTQPPSLTKLLNVWLLNVTQPRAMPQTHKCPIKSDYIYTAVICLHISAKLGREGGDALAEGETGKEKERQNLQCWEEDISDQRIPTCHVHHSSRSSAPCPSEDFRLRLNFLVTIPYLHKACTDSNFSESWVHQNLVPNWDAIQFKKIFIGHYMSQDNYPKKREGTRERRRRWERKGERGRERKERDSEWASVWCVMRLCSAMVKVTAFSQSLILNPDSTVPQLCDSSWVTKPLWASPFFFVKQR